MSVGPSNGSLANCGPPLKLSISGIKQLNHAVPYTADRLIKRRKLIFRNDARDVTSIQDACNFITSLLLKVSSFSQHKLADYIGYVSL